MPAKLSQYLRSRSTLLAILVAILMYLAYASAHAAWLNIALIAVCQFVAFFLPAYSRLSNKLEEITNLRFGWVTAGRLSRFGMQLAFNYAVFLAFSLGRVIEASALEGIGGTLGIAALTTLVSQGAQYLAIVLFNRGVGDLNGNVIVALSINILVTAAATTGSPFVKVLFLGISSLFGTLIFGMGVLSDLRAYFHPQRGIGVFFGTFNPFHITHAQIIRRAVEERGVSKILIHPTIVPKLHAEALRRGEIRVARIENGLSVLERTDRADLNVNYFPTGNRFYPPQTRKLMIELALKEAGLSDVAEVLWLPEVYTEEGFHGVIRAIKRLYPRMPLHGLHGSDLGGMWVRGIYDKSGWIYPMPVRRRDGVSATAIRNGAAGMTSRVVEALLKELRAGAETFEVGGSSFRITGGLIVPVNVE